MISFPYLISLTSIRSTTKATTCYNYQYYHDHITVTHFFYFYFIPYAFQLYFISLFNSNNYVYYLILQSITTIHYSTLYNFNKILEITYFPKRMYINIMSKRTPIPINWYVFRIHGSFSVLIVLTYILSIST